MEYITKIHANDKDYNITVPGITLDPEGKYITSISMPTGSITCSTISATNAELNTIDKVLYLGLRPSNDSNNSVNLRCFESSNGSIILQTQAQVLVANNPLPNISNFNWRLTADRKSYDITVPNKSGTLALTSDLDNIDLTTAAGTYCGSSYGPLYQSVVYIDKNGYVRYEPFKGQGITIPAGAVLLSVKIRT